MNIRSIFFTLIILSHSTFSFAADVENSPQDPASIHEKDEAVKDEAVKDEAVKDEAVKDEAVKDEAVKDEAVKDEAVKDEAVKDEIEAYYDKSKESDKSLAPETEEENLVDNEEKSESENDNTLAALAQIGLGTATVYLLALPLTLISFVISFVPVIGSIGGIVLSILRVYISASVVTSAGNAMSDRQGVSLPSFIAESASTCITGGLSVLISYGVIGILAVFGSTAFLTSIEDFLREGNIPGLSGILIPLFALTLVATLISIPIGFVTTLINQSVSTYVYYKFSDLKTKEQNNEWAWPDFIQPATTGNTKENAPKQNVEEEQDAGNYSDINYIMAY